MSLQCVDHQVYLCGSDIKIGEIFVNASSVIFNGESTLFLLLDCTPHIFKY